jgi:GxxExxY protein
LDCVSRKYVSRKERKGRQKKGRKEKMTENEISFAVIGVAIKLHKHLGPGLLESVYENALAYELRTSGLFVEQQLTLPMVYNEIKMECGYRIDLRVERKLIIEIKSIEMLAPVHFAQVLTYLRLSECKLGLLINFNTVRLKEGIHRIVNNL